MRWLTALLLSGVLLAEMKPEVQTLLDAAPGLPPEVGASVLLRLAASGQVTEAKLRRQMLEEAYRLAGSAKFATPVRRAGESDHTDTDINMTARAVDEGLSTLALRLRVVEQLLPLDAPRARELFERIQVPLDTLRCTDGMRSVPDGYYRTLLAVYRTAFTAAERAQGLDLALAADRLRTINSATQLGGAADFLLQVATARWSELLDAYTAALASLQSDDRTFTSSVDTELAGRIVKLAQLAQQRQVAAAGLAAAWQGFLSRHLNGQRCADNIADGPARQRLQFVLGLSKYLAGDTGQPPDVARELRWESFTPKPLDGKPLYRDFWFDRKEDKAILNGLKRLRFGGTTEEVPEQQRTAAQWESQVRPFLEQVDDWHKAPGGPAVFQFHRLMYVYRSLLSYVPPGSAREQVLAAALSQLESSPVRLDSPAEWTFYARSLLRNRYLGNEKPLDVLGALAGSREPALKVLAELERLGVK